MAIEDLRVTWTEVYGRPPPVGLKSDLLRRGIAFAWQAALAGDPSPRVRRLLQASPSSPRASSVKPGTRLVRSWQGETHHVLVMDEGVEYRGRQYPSLSAVARHITGTRWSGPRFFGLVDGRPR